MAQDGQDHARAIPQTGSDGQDPQVYLADSGRMILPEEANLLHASYARRGDDLQIGGADRPALVILDYFAPDKSPDLQTEGGAVLPNHVIVKLAGPDPDRAAKPAEGPAREPIGHVEHVDGEVIITRADGSQVVATRGTPVFQDDIITTDGAGGVGLRFVDGMTLSLGSDARMVLDEFVYNPEANEGGGIIEIIQGAFSFVSGAAAKMGLDSMVIETPTMTIGIRGTKVVANAAAEGETTEVVLLPEDDGTIGKIMISTDAGQELLEQPFVSTTVSSRFLPPAAQSFVTPEWVYSHYSEPLAALPIATIEEDDRGLDLEAPSAPSNARFNGADRADLREIEPVGERRPIEAEAPGTASSNPAEEPTPPPAEAVAAAPAAAQALARQATSSEVEAPVVREIETVLDEPAASNTAPVLASPISDSRISEDGALDVDLSEFFSDADLDDGDVLTFSAVQSDGSALPSWLSIDPASGVLSGTPGDAGVGSLTLTVTATDNAGENASSDFQITVSNVNDAPVVVTPISDAGVTEDAVFSFDASTAFADDDAVHGDVLTFSAVQSDGSALPSWLSIDPSTGVLAGTPLNGDIGLLDIDVTATDRDGASTTSGFRLTIANDNDTPVVVTPLADRSLAEDDTFSYDASASFADDDAIHGDALTFSATRSDGTVLPSWLSIDPSTGVLTGIPLNGDVGLLDIEVTATDTDGATATSAFQLTIDNRNDVPVAVTPVANGSATEDNVFSYDASAGFADDDTIHGDALTFSAVQSDGTVLPSWLSIDAATGVLTGTPLNADVGLLDVEVTATDSAGASATASYQLTIANDNDTPVVVNQIADRSLAEDAVFSYDASANFRDDDTIHGDVLTFVAMQSDGSALPSWLSIDPSTGVLSGTPLNGDVGVLDIEVVAVDATGAGAATIFQLTVNNVNDAPVVVAPIANASPLQDAYFRYDVSSNFADDDSLHGDVLTFSAFESGSGAQLGWLSIDPVTGVLFGTPDASHVGGALTIEVIATDASGASVNSSFQLSIDNVNDAPVLNITPSPVLTTVEANATDPTGNSIGEIIIDGSIIDPDGNAVEAMALTAVDDSNGSWQFSIDDGTNWVDVGTVSDSAALLLDASARLRFIPDPGFGGSAKFAFRAWDQTTGSNGQTGVDVSINGGSTAFSLATETGSVSVQAGGLDLSSGTEFQINTTTAGQQAVPFVSALADGGFLVTWESKDQDGDNWGIYGQRYDETGSAVSSEFQINTTTADEQRALSATGLAEGGFVVTWQSKDQDGDNWGVYGQRYDSAGSAVGSEFQINTETLNEQKDPEVTSLADGGFVVTWESKDQDGDNWGIYGQRYDHTGSAVGSEFQINTTTADEQRDPMVTGLANGGFVVAWESKNQDGDNWGVYGQRYDSAGSAVGSEFQINMTTAGEQQDPRVTALDDGGFVVVWQSKDQDGDNWGIFGQRYDSAGNPVEFEFQVNQETSKEQQDAKVETLADGGFLVTWQSKDQDGDNWGIYGRRFGADGDPMDDEFQINTTSAGEQKSVSAATLADGGLAVTWQSRDQDGDDWGVYGHVYESETASVTVNPPQTEAAAMLDFGGTSSFVDVGSSNVNGNDLDPGLSDFTVEAWFYYDGAGGRQTIVSKGNDGDLEGGFSIFLDGDELVVRASIDGAIDSAARKVTLGGEPGWHHVAMVIDQEAGLSATRITGYLDGSQVGWSTGHGSVSSSTMTTSESRQIESDERFLIGASDNNGSAEDFFDGEIADVRVWSTARSQADIQADMGRTLNGNEPSLLANWQLDDGSGSTVSDGAGHYDGVLSGNPIWQDALNLTTAQDTTLAGRLSASDPDGDALTYSVAAGAANGTATIDAEKGTWTYDPLAGFSGSDSFSYQVSDGNGGTDTVTIAVTVT